MVKHRSQKQLLPKSSAFVLFKDRSADDVSNRTSAPIYGNRASVCLACPVAFTCLATDSWIGRLITGRVTAASRSLDLGRSAVLRGAK